VNRAVATAAALLLAILAWWGSEALLEVLGLAVLGLPARFGVVFLVLCLAEAGLRRLALNQDNPEGAKQG